MILIIKENKMNITCPDCLNKNEIQKGQISRLNYDEEKVIFHFICDGCGTWLEGTKNALIHYDWLEKIKRIKKKEVKMKNIITITVEGGLIQGIENIPKDMIVKVIDLDCNEELGDRESVKEIGGNLAWVTEWKS